MTDATATLSMNEDSHPAHHEIFCHDGWQLEPFEPNTLLIPPEGMRYGILCRFDLPISSPTHGSTIHFCAFVGHRLVSHSHSRIHRPRQVISSPVQTEKHTHTLTYVHAYLVCCALQTLFKNPSRCANRFMQSSPSALDRTNPQSAYVWFSPVYRPFSSTLPTLIWTEAWSLALMIRFVALHLRGT